MSNDFVPITLDENEKYYEYWQKTPKRSLDYTLANLWGWQEYYGLEWQFDGQLCWIRQTLPEVMYWAPLGNWHEVEWTNALTGSLETDRHFIRVPESLVNIWKNSLGSSILAGDERGQWEYLYKQTELADLPGNRFHKKRNHFNSYIKNYGEPVYEAISDKMVEDVLGVQDDWCQWHECDDSPSLRAENEAVNRVLSNWGHFRNMVGGSLYVDGKMIAFSIGEKLDPQNLGVHFEKGLNGYKGVYQVMNCEFARNAGKGFEWINRAQDLDEEGLRQAKMTYLPADFLRKYKVTVRKSS